MVAGWVLDNGTAAINDYYSMKHEHPHLDTTLAGGVDNVKLVSGSRTGNVTTLRFTRALNTGDKWDTVLDPTTVVDMVYANMDGPPGITFHFDRHNHVRVDLSRSDGVPQTTFGQEEVGMASRELVNTATFATLVTLQSEVMVGREQFAGFPYGSVASFADTEPSTGMPILLLSTLERNVINWEDDARCTLAIQNPPTNASEPMMERRTTLFGTLVEIPAKDIPAAKAAYLKKHPIASGWIDFDDFALCECMLDARCRCRCAVLCSEFSCVCVVFGSRYVVCGMWCVVLRMCVVHPRTELLVLTLTWRGVWCGVSPRFHPVACRADTFNVTDVYWVGGFGNMQYVLQHCVCDALARAL